MQRLSACLLLICGFVLAVGMSLPPQSQAASYSTDVIPTLNGDLRITPIYHASLMLQFRGKVIDVDPISQGDYSNLPRPDLILITHAHPDHLSPPTINKIKKSSTIIVAPPSVAKTVTEARVIRNGGKITIDGIPIQAVPMYNIERGPAPGKLYHPKGWGNGYILTLGDKRIYISGDTECTPEMRALKHIDVAFLCMNLPYTMTPQEAAECVKVFKPKIVYPYHYRGQDTEKFAAALKGTGVEVRLRNWYPK